MAGSSKHNSSTPPLVSPKEARALIAFANQNIIEGIKPYKLRRSRQVPLPDNYWGRPYSPLLRFLHWIRERRRAKQGGYSPTLNAPAQLCYDLSPIGAGADNQSAQQAVFAKKHGLAQMHDGDDACYVRDITGLGRIKRLTNKLKYSLLFPDTKGARITQAYALHPGKNRDGEENGTQMVDADNAAPKKIQDVATGLDYVVKRLEKPQGLMRGHDNRAAEIKLSAHAGLSVADTMTDDKAYIIMPLGEPLERVLTRPNITPQDKLTIAAQLMGLLAHLHGTKNIAHLDIKPPNIIQTQDKHDIPHLQFIDYGAAVELNGDPGFNGSCTEVYAHPPTVVFRFYTIAIDKHSTESYPDKIRQYKAADCYAMAVMLAYDLEIIGLIENANLNAADKATLYAYLGQLVGMPPQSTQAQITAVYQTLKDKTTAFLNQQLTLEPSMGNINPYARMMGQSLYALGALRTQVPPPTEAAHLAAGALLGAPLGVAAKAIITTTKKQAGPETPGTAVHQTPRPPNQ